MGSETWLIVDGFSEVRFVARRSPPWTITCHLWRNSCASINSSGNVHAWLGYLQVGMMVSDISLLSRTQDDDRKA